ncbi:UbiA family prenyltransferase [Streptomyces sp. G-G2]|uniref:UbiA family prenyltransferase n=1 Tax=Streptomyces sp. G-G2 TaxID=3046201 RepID=UPI0024BB7909|nr:UbiA family prenyltransferase [Streptomyces sp. G-G2]MDJ0383058.1 UbiA family prenyltransferase [Streptomyces sp. G-G2]
MTLNAARPVVAPSGPEEFAALSPPQREQAVRTTPGASGWGETVRITLLLGRPRTCVPGMLTFALGWTVAGGPVSGLFFTGLAVSLVYGLLANTYNAYTDLAEDSRNLPGRVWQVLRIGHRRLLWISHAMSALLLGLSLLYSVAYVVPMALALVGAHQYSFLPGRLKARPVTGLFAFSLAVFGPYLLGYLAAPSGVRRLTGDAWAILAFLVIWFVAKGMVKNLPDYDGDRDAGLRTSATVFADRLSAARAATVVTLVGYLSLTGFVLAGSLPLRTLAALPWAVAAFLQCRAMAKAVDNQAANAVLKADMILSTAFLASVLVLRAPGWATALSVAIGAVILFGSDRLALDSRRQRDGAAPTRTA